MLGYNKNNNKGPTERERGVRVRVTLFCNSINNKLQQLVK
jgi:hypothetical protein